MTYGSDGALGLSDLRSRGGTSHAHPSVQLNAFVKPIRSGGHDDSRQRPWRIPISDLNCSCYDEPKRCRS
jgi:hypothetical protein